MEGKLVKNSEGQLVVEQGPDGKPKHRGSGRDMSYPTKCPMSVSFRM
jgi:hypothetical protein